MVQKPTHIADERWGSLDAEQREIEREACDLVYSREFISHDTNLIADCLHHGVMSKRDIVNFPQPEDWSAEQCKIWCKGKGDDIESEIAECDRAAIEVWLADVIQYGMDQIETETLRKILLKRLEDTADYGVSLWRRIVEAATEDVFEWWGVDETLAEDLIQIGECVLKNKYGNWWGRCTVGQSVLLDGVLQGVVRRRRSAKQLRQ